MFFCQSQSSSTKAKHGCEPKAKQLTTGTKSADIDWLYVALKVILNISQSISEYRRATEHICLLIEEYFKVLYAIMNTLGFTLSLLTYNYCK
jgi:hypothetical protein